MRVRALRRRRFDYFALNDRITAIKFSMSASLSVPSQAGMKGAPSLDIDLGALPKGAAICDIVYNPLETPLAMSQRPTPSPDGLMVPAAMVLPSGERASD